MTCHGDECVENLNPLSNSETKNWVWDPPTTPIYLESKGMYQFACGKTLFWICFRWLFTLYHGKLPLNPPSGWRLFCIFSKASFRVANPSYQLLPVVTLLISQMKVTSPLKRSRIKTPEKVTNGRTWHFKLHLSEECSWWVKLFDLVPSLLWRFSWFSWLWGRRYVHDQLKLENLISLPGFYISQLVQEFFKINTMYYCTSLYVIV